MLTKKSLIISTLLVFVICILWGYPYFTWGFVNDDYLFLLYCKNTPWSNILSFFYHGSPSNNHVVANAPMPHLSFLMALFRPLLSLFLKIQCSLFDLSAYWYKVAGILIHLSITIILFHFFSRFFSTFLALWGTILFAFHQSLWEWIGVYACQTYAYDLLFLVLCIFFLKKFLDSHNILFYLLAIGFTFIGMLNRETLIFIPPWILAAVYLYKENFAPANLSLRNIFYAIKTSIGFWLASTTYFLFKLSLFPYQKNDSGICFTFSLGSFINRQKERFFDIVTYFCDFFCVSLIPGNHQFLKGFILLGLATLLIIPFFMKKKKALLFFLCLTFFIFNWPSLLIVHHARYLYVTLPFFIYMTLFAIDFYLIKLINLKKILLLFLYLLFIPLGIMFINFQHNTAVSLSSFTNAIKQLAYDQALVRKPLTFIGLPMPWSGIGIKEGLKLFNPCFKNQTFFIKDSYRLGIKFLTNTSHTTHIPTNQQIESYKLHYSAPANMIFITWDFKKKNFLILREQYL